MRPGRSADSGAGGGVWRDWGGSGPTLHFAHANGFPAATYRVLLEAFRKSFHVVSSEARPLWSNEAPTTLESWAELAADQRRELESRGLSGIVGVGHSLGAAMSLLAAAEAPGLFRAVVAIDPLVMTGSMSVVWGLMKRFGLSGRLNLVNGARSRRKQWPDRDTVRRGYRPKRIFKGWQASVLEDYLDAGLVLCADGSVRLRYPRDWEARIFQIAPHNLWPELRRVQVPVLFIRGAHSDTFTEAARRRVLREMPSARVEVVPGTTHFVPMEQPERVSRLATDFVAGVDQKGEAR